MLLSKVKFQTNIPKDVQYLMCLFSYDSYIEETSLKKNLVNIRIRLHVTEL